MDNDLSPGSEDRDYVTVACNGSLCLVMWFKCVLQCLQDKLIPIKACSALLKAALQAIMCPEQNK